MSTLPASTRARARDDTSFLQTSPRPPQHPRPSPQQLVDRYSVWLKAYLAAVIGIAVFGGQITFTLIVGQLADPAPSSVFGPSAVRHLIAASWLLFTATLGVGVLTSLLFTDDADHYGTGKPRGLDGAFGWLISFLLNFLPIGAFLLLGLATAAYAPVVGWIGVAGIAGFGLVVARYWLFGW
ncbi:hypothetical protein VTI74DRAFT_2429 [Chaetomium olivicolor]